MADFSQLSMSHQTRARLTELADQASRFGIDRNAVVAAGPVALRALLALKKAVESETEDNKTRYLHQVRDALQILEHRSHPELVQQFQARILALQGRGSDTEIAHVARREIVVPVALQNEDVVSALRKAAQSYGVPLEMLTVGHAMNNINPETGAPEFGVMDWINGLFGQGEAPQQSTPTDSANKPGLFIPNVNAPDVKAPTSDALGFDPTSPGHIGAAWRDPLGALMAGAATLAAWDATERRYPGVIARDNEADAYKHTAWNYLMARTMALREPKRWQMPMKSPFQISRASNRWIYITTALGAPYLEAAKHRSKTLWKRAIFAKRRLGSELSRDSRTLIEDAI